MKVDAVAAIVAEILMDTAKVRWRPAAHERNLNSAIRECVDLRPDAYTKVRSLQLAAGTEQALDANGRYLIKVVCNLGAAGSVQGKAPRVIEAQTMDAFSPNWRAAVANGVVRNIVFDPETPRRFETYPPQPDPAHYLRLIQSEYPAVITLGSSTDFPLPDDFINACVQLSLYFGWQKASGGDLQRAGFHRSEALKMLGLSGQSQNKNQGAT